MENFKKIMAQVGKVLINLFIITVGGFFLLLFIRDVTIILRYKGEYCRPCDTCDAMAPCENTNILPYSWGELFK